MSLSVPPLLESYSLYMPVDDKTGCYAVQMPRNARVEHLEDKVRGHEVLERLIGKQRVHLYRVPEGNLSRKTPSRLYGDATQWLKFGAESAQMDSSEHLCNYFPDGPQPERDEMVDVIAITDSMLDSISTSATPETRRTTTKNKGTPRKSEREIQDLVDKYLDRFGVKLKEYLAGPAWNDFWKAPPTCDPLTAAFIDDLKLPKLLEDPVLLLHDLGNGVVEECVVDSLFSEKPQFLVNASGSGKTRLLFEGLSRNWGFYFTARINHRLGSLDIGDAIQKCIPRSTLFDRNAEQRTGYERSAAYWNNRVVAERCTFQVLRARIIVFEYFLKTISAFYGDQDIDGYRKHWLFLQICSWNILGEDVFQGLTNILTDANDEYLLMTSDRQIHTKLSMMKGEFGLGGSFYFVLDEAQVAAGSLQGCFPSDRDNSIKHPVLRPIIKAWLDATDYPIIVSGTSLSVEIIDEVGGYYIARPDVFERRTETRAFDSEESQRRYILRYMPTHIAQSDSGKEFLKRTWKYFRGRHRFTASLLTSLLSFSFKSIHRVLNGHVKKFCGFHPSDAQWFIAHEESIDEDQIMMMMPLDFSRLSRDSELLNKVSEVLYTWLIKHHFMPLAAKYRKLVELGFARFPDANMYEAVIDEPLVLLAALHEFSSSPVCSFHRFAVERTYYSSGDGLEELVAYFYACAFQKGRRLCDVFDFQGNAPDWAMQPAELVSISWNDGKAEAQSFHLLEFLDGATDIGLKCGDVEETLDWFEKPTSFMCFPDRYMGPDIGMFIRLASGLVLAVFTRTKWTSSKFLQRDALLGIVKTTDPNSFFGREKPIDSKYGVARQRIIQRLKLLNEDVPIDDWFQDAIPVLRVVASDAKIETQDLPAPCVALNMDLVEKIKDSGYLFSVAGMKRAADGDIVSRPRKKRG